MKSITSVLVLILFISCNHQSNELQSEVQTIDMARVAFACDCADWVRLNDLSKPNYADSAIFIEPADSTLNLADTLGYNMDIIKFTGQFYIHKGFPNGYHSIENPDKARVFRYIKFKIIKSNYRESQQLNEKGD
jgi:hypothetical protein